MVTRPGLQEKAQYVLQKLEEIFPEYGSELTNWETPFQFLICVALSAQTTDKQVNKVTEQLFAKYPDPASLAKANPEDVSEVINKVNFRNNKARNAVKAAQVILEEFNGAVPKTEAELVRVPGVGRKTAHVFLNEIYKSNDGIASDTHVMRVSQRLSFTKETDPGKVSADLERIFDKKDWYKINSLMVLFGRYICTAKKPKSEHCPFDWCECHQITGVKYSGPAIIDR